VSFDLRNRSKYTDLNLQTGLIVQPITGNQYPK